MSCHNLRENINLKEILQDPAFDNQLGNDLRKLSNSIKGLNPNQCPIQPFFLDISQAVVHLPPLPENTHLIGDVRLACFAQCFVYLCDNAVLPADVFKIEY